MGFSGGIIGTNWGQVTGTMSNQTDLNTVLTATATWQKFTKTSADLAFPNVTNNITLFTLNPKQIISQIVMKHSVSFTGGTISNYTVSVGITGSLTKYLAAFGVFGAVTDASNVMSIPTTVTAMESYSGSTAIKIAATSTGGNLDTATQGSVDVWVLLSTLS